MEIIGDFTTSVEKALDEIDKNWKRYRGLVVCGSHEGKYWEEAVLKLKKAREDNIPTLAICFGMQMMIVDWARHMQGWEDAQSSEISLVKHMVVGKLPELRVGIFPVDGVMESHWHNYANNPLWTDPLIDMDWEIIRTDKIIEYMRLKNHPFFVGVQYHPEYQSSKEKPHHLLLQFIDYCK